MPHTTLRPLLHHLSRPADLKDGDLLQRFARDRDEDAFRILVERHGRLVLGVCRRHAGRTPDAEDAFQGTFLLLARKAPGLVRHSGVAGWLATAARHLACRARRAAARRAVHEARAVPPVRPTPDPALADLGAVLDAELARLPADEREAFTVCLLEGLSRTEAAERLGWPEGTVAGRLARARERLRLRLARRGLTLSAVLTALGVAEADAVPARLCDAAVAAARPGPVGATRFAVAASVLLGLGTVLALGMGTQQTPPADPPPKAKAKAESAPRVDAVGDPLPDRVIARIGHTRFRHESGVRSLAVSPDGSLVATATWGGFARVWDADTGKARHAWRASRADYSEIAIAFVGAGSRLFVGPGDEPPQVIEAATGKVVWKGEAADPMPASHMSPDGTRLLELGTDGAARVRDVKTGKAAFAEPLLNVGAGQFLRSVVFLPDGASFVLSTGTDGLIREVSAATGKEGRRYPSGLTFPSVAVSPDGKLLAAYQRGDFRKAGATDTVVVWGRAKNEKRFTVSRQFPDPLCLAFCPDGKTFAVGSQGADVILMSTADGAEVRRFAWHPSCLSLAFSPDGKTLYTGDGSGQVAKWEVATGKRVPLVPAAMPEAVYAGEFRGTEIVTTGDRFGWWAADTGKPLRALADTPRPPTFTLPRLSPDGKRLVHVREKYPEPARLIELAVDTNRERVLVEKLPGGFGIPQFTPDGRLIAVAGGFAPTVAVIDAASGKVIRVLQDHKTFVNNVLFSPDGKTLISHGSEANARGDYDIRVWDVASGKLLHKLLPTRASAFKCAFTPDGKGLVSVGGDPGRPNNKGEAHLWDLTTGTLVRMWDAHAERVVGVAVSPDGRSVLTSGIDKKLRLWELAGGGPRHEFVGHTAYAHDLAFGPDGRRFLAVSGDAPCYVWDVYGHLTAAAKPLTPAEAVTAWADLSSDDPAVGFRAIGALARGGAVADLAGRLKPVGAADAKAVEAWLTDLGSPRFAVRERAAAELAKVADQARPRLRKALETEPSAEARERVKKLLDGADADTPEWRAQRRGVEALEVIGTPAARGMVAALAKGAPGARLTAEAGAALGRMK